MFQSRAIWLCHIADVEASLWVGIEGSDESEPILPFWFGAFSSREPVSTSLENAMSTFERNEHGACGNQGYSKPAVERRPLAEKGHAKQRYEHHAQFVDRRHQSRRPELQRAEIAQPRGAGAEPGKHQKDPALLRERPGIGELAGRKQDQRKADQDDDGADEGGEVGIDVLDADLGEDRGQGGEHRRQHRPDLPGGKGLGAHEGTSGGKSAVVPGRELTNELRCAIAHLRTSRFSDVQLHIVVRCCASPRNDAKRQFLSSGSTGSGVTSTPSSIKARASSGEASP